MTPDPATAKRRQELILAGAAAFLLVAQQVASKATRDALFLTSFDPRRLPIVMASGAMLSLLAVVAMSRAISVRGPGRAVPAGLVVNATFFALEWIAAPLARDGTAVAVYLHVATLGSVLISGFWSLTSERFDPNRAKRHFSRIAAAGTFGGVVGGVSVEVFASRFGARSMLLVLAAASLLAAAVIAKIGEQAKEEGEVEVTETPSALGLLRGMPFLRALATMSMLAAVWAALLDFAFKAEASRIYADEASLVSFFAWFYTGTSLVTFLLQSLLGRMTLQRIGLPGTIALLPLMVAGGGLGLLFGAPFAALVAIRAGESVISNSLYRAAYEQLFTPLSPETKRPTKALVDVAATRIGDALGALLVLVLIYSWHEMPGVVPVVVAGGAALLSLLIVPRLASGYVEALRAALRTGNVELEDHGVLDATTRRTLSDTAVALDRERLLHEIEALRRTASHEVPPGTLSITSTSADAVAAAAAATAVIVAHPEPEVEGEVVSAAPPPTEPRVVQRFAALASGATDRARRALEQPLETELVPITLHLLAHPQLGSDALRALKRVAPPSTGLLVDALLDPRTPFEVRFRVPRVLRVCITRRASEGLALGLEDPRLEVRFQCARALVHLASADEDLAPPTPVVFAAVERELAERGATWTVATQLPPHDANHADHHDDEPLSLDELMRMRASRSLQYVLTLLSLVVDGEALQLALRGLSANEEQIRGTAIELLENVLPDPVRGSLLTVLASRERSETRARSREEIVAELLRSQESLPLLKPRGA